MFHRRSFLAASGFAVAGRALFAATGRFSLSRIAFITDEAAASPEDAIAFAHQYGLQWLELREVPGAKRSYDSLEPDELKKEAKRIREAGLRVSFFNSGGTKYALPGTEPLRPPARPGWREQADAQYQRRKETLRRQIAAAQTFDTQLVRVFAFARVADTTRIWDRLADELGQLHDVARQEGATLLLENEAACNVGSCAEFAALMKLLPSGMKINWDANNGQSSSERPFPDGYALLPKERIANVHMHGRTFLDPEKKLDWPAIFAALDRDGYRGCAGLETHYFDGTKIEKSHLCLEELRRMLRA